MPTRSLPHNSRAPSATCLRTVSRLTEALIVVGHAPEHVDLVPATLLGARAASLLVLASGFFRLPALGGEALEGFDAQP